MEPRGPHPVRADLLEELGHDRLAHRLARGPAALGQVIENLIQYSTSGVPAFQQRAAVAALEQGESFVADQIARARRGRAIVCDGLVGDREVELPPPPGAFYAFLKVKGVSDARGARACGSSTRRMSALRPGTAFGDGGRGLSSPLLRPQGRGPRGGGAPPRRRCGRAPEPAILAQTVARSRSDRRRRARRFRLPPPRHPGGVAVGLDRRRGDPRAPSALAADAAPARRRRHAGLRRHHGRRHHARGARRGRALPASLALWCSPSSPSPAARRCGSPASPAGAATTRSSPPCRARSPPCWRSPSTATRRWPRSPSCSRCGCSCSSRCCRASSCPRRRRAGRRFRARAARGEPAGLAPMLVGGLALGLLLERLQVAAPILLGGDRSSTRPCTRPASRRASCRRCSPPAASS